MNLDEKLSEILKDLADQSLSLTEAQQKIKALFSLELGFAELDLGRSMRTGFPEVIFAERKTDEEIEKIVEALIKFEQPILLTRVRQETYQLLFNKFRQINYYERSKTIIVGQFPEAKGKIAVVSAGTADYPVAEEAFLTARFFGAEVITFYDIGIAGLHRLLAKISILKTCKVVVAVAGMDGALPTVLAGLLTCPVIAIPTSIGYGANFSGLAPLLTMLNACAPGIAVVNIDNGFGGGYLAALINRQSA